MTRDEVVAGAFEAIQRGSKSFVAFATALKMESRDPCSVPSEQKMSGRPDSGTTESDRGSEPRNGPT